jgi:hypothetical protein
MDADARHTIHYYEYLITPICHVAPSPGTHTGDPDNPEADLAEM